MLLASLATGLFCLARHAKAGNQLILSDDEASLTNSITAAQQSITQTSYYVNQNVTQWQNQWAAGKYLLSISVIGLHDVGSQKFATVWYPQPWASQMFRDSLKPAFFVDWATSHQAVYIPTLISCWGNLGSAVCAGSVDRNDNNLTYQIACDMTQQQLFANDSIFTNQNMSLKSFTEYGNPSANDGRLYCAIWHGNPDHDVYEWQLDLPASDYQTFFDSQITKPYWRPNYLSVSSDSRITSLFNCIDNGNWAAAHGMNSATLIARQQQWSSQGLQLVHLQAGGPANNPTYAAIWTALPSPQVRQWSVVGATSGFVDNAAATVQVDGLTQSFMQHNGIRQAQVAVSHNGILLMERAYTWAEPARPRTHTSDAFLLASVSKMFCEAAVQVLFNIGTIKPGTTPFADKLLTGYPWQASSPLHDARMKDITVQQLLDHTAGFNLADPNGPGDATYLMPQISRKLGIDRPPNIVEFVGYLRDYPLNYTPGSPPGGNYVYSNLGYAILQAVVETVTGQPYYKFIQAHVSSNVQIWHTDSSYHLNDSIVQESSFVGQSALRPLSSLQVADVYGGDGMYKETLLGTCGLAASATVLALFANNHAVWGNGPNCGSTGCGRWGSTPGARSFVYSRPNCIDFAVNINTRDFDGDPLGLMEPLIQFLDNVSIQGVSCTR